MTIYKCTCNNCGRESVATQYPRAFAFFCDKCGQKMDVYAEVEDEESRE